MIRSSSFFFILPHVLKRFQRQQLKNFFHRVRVIWGGVNFQLDAVNFMPLFPMFLLAIPSTVSHCLASYTPLQLFRETMCWSVTVGTA